MSKNLDKDKNGLFADAGTSAFAQRKRIKNIPSISEKTNVRVVSTGGKKTITKKGATFISATTLEFQDAYGSLSKNPAYARKTFIDSFDRIIESSDYVGVDFITIQSVITEDSSIKVDDLADQATRFLQFLWPHLYSKANIEIAQGVIIEVVEISGLLVPVINSGILGQEVTKQRMPLKAVLDEAVDKAVIGGKPENLKMLEIFFETAVESAKFGYIVELQGLLMFRRDGGSKSDLALIPGSKFFDQLAIIKESNTKVKKRKGIRVNAREKW